MKDSLLTAGVFVTLIFTAIGVYNKCSCWSTWFPDHDQRYLSFPQEQFVFDIIRTRLEIEFPAVVGGCLSIELLIFFAVALRFRLGHRVLKQQDIDDILEEQPLYKRLLRRFRSGFKQVSTEEDHGQELREEAGRQENEPV